MTVSAADLNLGVRPAVQLFDNLEKKPGFDNFYDGEVPSKQSYGLSQLSTTNQLEILKKRLETGEKIKAEMVVEITDLKMKLEKSDDLNKDLKKKIATDSGQSEKETIDELERRIGYANEEKDSMTSIAKNAQTQFDDLRRIVIAAIVEEPDDLNASETTPEAIANMLVEYTGEKKSLRDQIDGLERRLEQANESTKQSQQNVHKLLEQIEALKQQQVVHEAVVKEDESITEQEISAIQSDLRTAKERAQRRDDEIERMRIEVRAHKAKSAQLDAELERCRVLNQATLTERRAFKETLSALLNENYSTPLSIDDEEIKQRIRNLMRAKGEEEERSAHMLSKLEASETRCAQQARMHRLAIIRARSAEEEHGALRDRLQLAEEQLRATEIINENLERNHALCLNLREQLFKIMRLNELEAELGLEKDDNTLLARAEQLVEIERDWSRLSDQNTDPQVIENGGGLNGVQKCLNQGDGHSWNLRDQRKEIELKKMHLDLLKKKLRHSATPSSRGGRKAVTRSTKAIAVGERSSEAEQRFFKQQLDDQSRLIRDLQRRLRHDEQQPPTATTGRRRPTQQINVSKQFGGEEGGGRLLQDQSDSVAPFAKDRASANPDKTTTNVQLRRSGSVGSVAAKQATTGGDKTSPAEIATAAARPRTTAIRWKESGNHVTK